MDINDLRSISTLLLFVSFLVIVAWAWSARNRASFDEASSLPFCGEQPSNSSPLGGRNE